MPVARHQVLDPSAHLDRNDANRVFAALGDLVVTGPTNTNLLDLYLVVIG
jgi:hydroxypyruvate reductase